MNKTHQQNDLSTSCLNELKADPIKSGLPLWQPASHPANPPLPSDTPESSSVQLGCHGDEKRDGEPRLKIAWDRMPTVGSKQDYKTPHRERRTVPSIPQGVLLCHECWQTKQTAESFMNIDSTTTFCNKRQQKQQQIHKGNECYNHPEKAIFFY